MLENPKALKFLLFSVLATSIIVIHVIELFVSPFGEAANANYIEPLIALGVLSILAFWTLGPASFTLFAILFHLPISVATFVLNSDLIASLEGFSGALAQTALLISSPAENLYTSSDTWMAATLGILGVIAFLFLIIQPIRSKGFGQTLGSYVLCGVYGATIYYFLPILLASS